MGLRQALVGVSHECDYPHDVAQLPRVTASNLVACDSSSQIDAMVSQQVAQGAALYSLDLEALHRLNPDLVVTQSLCHVCAIDEEATVCALSHLGAKAQVITLRANTLEQIFEDAIELGRAAGCELNARQLVAGLRERLSQVAQSVKSRKKEPSVVVLEWLDPLYSAGHWTPQLVEMAGAVELLGRTGQRSRRLTWEELASADPEYLVVACCGYSVQQAEYDLQSLQCNVTWNQLQAVREGRVLVMDGSAYFNRPGPRLVDTVEILSQRIFPAV